MSSVYLIMVFGFKYNGIRYNFDGLLPIIPKEKRDYILLK